LLQFRRKRPVAHPAVIPEVRRIRVEHGTP
jgi:hypothetical protein